MNNFFTGNTSGNNFSRDFSKGKSFQFSGTWNQTTVYNNDGFIQDFVVHNQKLWACIKNVSINSEPSETNNDWVLILDGVSDVEFRKNPENQNEIQWKYEDDEIWRDLIEFDIVSEDQIQKMLEDLDIKYGNTYDTELSETSTNAVQNQAVTKKFKKLDEKNTKTDSELVNIKSSVNTALSNSKSYTDSKISETKIQIDSGLNKKVNQSDVEEIVDELNKSINLKVDKVYGKGLSTNDFNANYKSKLDNLDSSLNSVLTSAKSHTNSEITKVDNKINSEISRAKISETNLSSRIDNLGEDVIKSLNEAKEYTDALANGEVKNNTNRINILNGIGEGSIIKTVKDEISNLVGTAPEKLDTLQEIADYLEEHEDMASGLVNSLSELETKKVDKTELNNFKTDTDSALQSLEKTKANTTGNYPLLHVGTADDLAGRGESVPASFGFRASGGKSIRDGRAYIKRIKGNSVVWNQKASSNRLVDSLGIAESTDIEGGKMITLTQDYTGSSDYDIRMTYNGQLIAGHMYCVSMDTYSSKGGRVNMDYGGSITNRGDIPANSWSLIATIGVAASNKASFSIYPNFKSIGYLAGDTFGVRNVRVTDLTQMFQAGNEPTMIEEFNARMATLCIEDMNAYNAGEVVNMKASAIKSVGFNAWDEEITQGYFSVATGEEFPKETSYIMSKNYNRILPSCEYYVLNTSGKAGRIGFWDKGYKFIETQLITNSGKHATPSNAYYFKVWLNETTYNHDICINLVHSGYRNGEYEPYVEDVLDLPTLDLFPNGMSKIGDAYDEYDEEKSVQRFGVVDMGTLNWNYTSGNISKFSCVMPSDARVFQDNVLPNIMTSLYTAQKNSTSLLRDKNIYLASKYVGVLDSAYTDAATFKAAMSGVLLYYELAEPIVTPYKQRLAYKVWDFGTEQSQSSVPSAPFSADIIYQFNAVDMIRENYLAIEEIKKNGGYDDTALKQQITNKQDKINDLATIRNGAALGATALQSVPSTYATKTDVANAISEAIINTLNTEV